MSSTDYAPPPTMSWTRVRILLVLVDFTALLLALQAAYVVRYSIGWKLSGEGVALDPLAPPLCLAVTLVSYQIFNLYSIHLVDAGLYEYRAVVTNTTFAFAAIVVFDYIDQGLSMSRAYLLYFWVAAILFVGTGRFLARRVLRAWSRLRGGLRRVLVVGANEQGAQIARELTSNPAAYSTVLGFLSEYRPVGLQSGDELPVLGEPMQLYEVAKRVGATHALVVESALSWESLRFIVRSMHNSRQLKVLLAPGLFDVAATPLKFTLLGRASVLIPQATRIVGFEAFFKRSLDLLIAVPALILTLPIQAAIWAGLRASGVPQPVVRFDARGFGGRRMTIRQFAGGPKLHATHLSRLPSLWLVIAGQMSVVGPRPVAQGDHGPYERWQDVLTALKPGFIGPWWLSYRRRPTAIQLEIRADLQYARAYNIWMDLRILLAVASSIVNGWLRGLTAARAAPDLRTPAGALADEDQD